MIRFGGFEGLGARVAAFTERADGDMGPANGAETAAARARICERLACDVARLVYCRQVHGARVVIAEELAPPGSWDEAAEADGILSGESGLPMVVFAADCAPVYLYDPEHGAGGLLHAGREGTRANICGAAVAMMAQRFGTNPGRLRALIGPSAGPARYEVSAEMAAEFAVAGLPTRGRRLDLWEANARRLEAAGVPPAHIVTSNICTISDGTYFSHRRGDSERNMALMAL